MKTKLLFLALLLLAVSGGLFAQGTQNVKGTYGCGSPPSSMVPGDVGTRYIDQCANPPVEWIITSVNLNGGGNGIPSATWTQGGSSSGGIPSASPILSVTVSPLCPAGNTTTCIQLPASGGMTWNGTFVNTSQTVTTTDNNFYAGMVGMRVFGTNVCKSGGTCEITSTVIVPVGTVTAFNSASSITVSNAATANCTAAGNQGCLLIWYNLVDTQMTTAWTAAGNACTTISVVDGVWGLSLPQFNSPGTVCPPGVGEGKTGIGLVGRSSSTTTFILDPAFTFTGCTAGVSGASCLFTAPGIYLSHLKVFGGGNSSVAGSTNHNLIEINTTSSSTAGLVDVIFAGYAGGTANSVGMFLNGVTPVPFVSVQVLGFGAINCAISGAGWGNALAQLNCEDALTQNMALGNVGKGVNSGPATVMTTGSIFGQSSNNNGICGGGAVFVQGSSVWVSDGDMINFGDLVPSPAPSICNSGTVYANHLRAKIGTTSGLSSIYNGGSLYLRDSIIAGSTVGTAYGIHNDAGTFFDMGGNQIAGNTAPVLANGGIYVPFAGGSQPTTQNVTTASTNFGTAIGSTNLIPSTYGLAPVKVSVTTRQITVGVSCTAGTNTATVTLAYTAPGSTAETLPATVLSISANGVVDSGSTAAQVFSFTPKANTAVTYSVASVLASTGCSPVPQYAVDLQVQ